MARRIYEGPKPNIVIVKLINEMTLEDMTCDAEIGLNKGQPLYVLLDSTGLDGVAPDGFLDGAKRSFLTNKNLVHMALYVESPAMRMIAHMVAKLTRVQHKISLHNDFDAAMRHLLTITK